MLYAFLATALFSVMVIGEDALLFFPRRQTVNALGVWTQAAWTAWSPGHNTNIPANLFCLLRDAS